MTSKYLPAGVSPLPWETADRNDTINVMSGRRAVCRCQRKIRVEPDARYIAHAANEHVALCEALEDLLAVFDRQDMASVEVPLSAAIPFNGALTAARALLARCEQAAR